MSKLIYPSEGIYSSNRDKLDECANNLYQARANCTFDIPSGFQETSFLNNLSSSLNSMKNEVTNIKEKIQKTNYNYEELETELTESAKKIETIKIVERDRMII